MMHLGLVKWFDNDKGFGRIGSVNGDDIFLHIDQFIVKPEKVLKLKALFFDIENNNKGNKATNVSIPETYEHFLYLMALLESNPKVNIEFTIKGKSRWGNEYLRKEYRDCSIFDNALYQLLRNKDPETIKNFYINYFNDNEFDSIEKIILLFKATKEVINKLELKKSLVENDTVVHEKVNSTQLILEIFKHYLSNIKQDYLFDIWLKSCHHPVKQSNTLVHKVYESNFQFPQNIFLDNYKKIDNYSLKRLLNDSKNEDICAKIVDKKINDFNEVNYYSYEQVKSSLFALLETDSFLKLDEKFRKKNVQNFINDKEKIKDSVSFEKFIKLIKREYIDNQKDEAISFINNNLDNETILKHWKEVNYFSPSIEFIENNIDKLSHYDFEKAPKSFHEKFFLQQYKKIKFNNTIHSFGHVLFLIFQTPYDYLDLISEDFSDNYKAALWLYGEAKKNNEYSSNLFNFNYNIKEFVTFLEKTESLDNVLDILKISFEISKKCNSYKKNSNSPENSPYKFSESEKIDFINNIDSKENTITSFTVLKWFINRWEDKRFSVFIQLFIPKFLNPETCFDEIFKNQYFIENSSKRIEFYNYIAQLISDINKVTLWINNYIYDIDLNLAINYLKTSGSKFEFIFLQKIFASIQSNKVLITDELYDQFKELSNNPKLNLDVRIALFVVFTLKFQKEYITDKTIFELVSQNLNENEKEFIDIDKLFDKCLGRTWKAYSYNAEGKEYWFVNFNGHEFPVDDNLVNIDGINYPINKEKRTININGVDHYFKWVKKSDVFHTENYGIPDGLTFCDAVKSQFDEELKSNFYWCCNSKCYSHCQKDYNLFQWEKYTLRDFIKILGIPFDNDLYYRFVSVINRVHRLLEKLKCNSCNKLMRDAATSEFAFYRVNTFHCTDSNCSEFHKTVYLTHCLNWRCLNIIDTRVSKACSNGWYICDKCDNCCSQEKIDMRYQNLLTNAVFNPNNPRHQKLKFQVDNKLGHLERNEVFNYKTGEKK